MKGDKQTKEQLLNELAELRRYVAELEKSENKGKRAKKAQLSSENFYKTIFGNIITAAAILGEDDTILLANKEFEQLTGYAREEVEGKKKWTEFVARKDELKQMKEYRRLRLIKPLSAPQKYEFQLVDRKGQVKDILTTIAKMPGKKQTLTTLLDITEHKRMEAALEKRIVALTRPLDDIKNIAFEDLFNLSDLQRLQDMLADSWGVAVLLTHPDGTAITSPSNFTNFCQFIRGTEKGFKNCQKSDARLGRYNPSGPIIHKCMSAGLWGAGASITAGGRQIANWLIGQVRNEAQSEEEIMKYARELGIDETAFREAFLQVPVMPQEKFEQIACTLFALANQLSAIAYQNIQQARFIVERKQAEEALQESEKRVRRKLDAILSPEGDIGTLELSDIIDTEKIQKLMDEFFDLTNLPMTITDLNGKVLVGIGWQDICTNFHRVNPESCRLCIESDLELTSNVQVGTFKKYRCKNNMWDIATPIMLGEKCVGNIFMGQFLFDNEKPDYETFRQQARKYGFDEQEYIEALDRVPRWSEKTINKAMSFFSIFAEIIGNLGYSNIKLANAVEERKRAEEELRESEKKYRRLHEAMTEAFAIVDLDGRIIESNHAYQSMLGYSEEELCHLTYSDITPEKWHALEKSIIEDQILLQGHAPIYEKEYQRKDGSVFPVELSTFLIRDEAGNPVSMWAIVHDITERKRAEAALKESEQKYNQFFRTSRDCVFITRDESLIDINDAAVELLGYSSREELLQVKVPDLYAEPEAEAKHFRIIAEYGYGKEYPVDFRRKDGSIRHTLVTSAARYDANGDLIGFQGTVRDVTEQRQNEEELRKYREKLEVLVAERTRELEDKTKNLEEVNTALNVLLKKRENDRKLLEENFVANIGSLVLPYLEKIRKNNLDAQQKFFLDTVEKNLDEIGSPLLKNIHQFNLTPREIQIAYLIKDGKTTKEIATVLGIVEGSISTHRKNIRKKLGLDRTSNLQSQLRFFEK